MIPRLSSEEATVLVLNGYAEGYLVKQGGRIKTWRKRYFEFRDGCLSYRKNRRDNSKVIRRDVIVDVHYNDKVRNGLAVTLLSGRVLQVSAKTDEQANIWFDVFSEFIFRNQKMNQLQEVILRRNERLEPIEECDYDCKDLDDDDIAILSDTDSDSEFWLYDF